MQDPKHPFNRIFTAKRHTWLRLRDLNCDHCTGPLESGFCLFCLNTRIAPIPLREVTYYPAEWPDNIS
jgi:hypothetical protein